MEALDRAGASTRIRLSATVVGVEHEGDPATADFVRITYALGGRLFRVRARGVVMAGELDDAAYRARPPIGYQRRHRAVLSIASADGQRRRAQLAHPAECG